MELRTYFEILWRRKWVVLLTILVSIVVVVITTIMTTPIYVASATLRVATVGSGVTGGRSDIGYTERLMNTYNRVVTSSTTRTQIKEQLALAARPVIAVESIPNTELMKISAEAADPAIAQQVAQTAAEILISQSRELYNGSGQTTLEILREQIQQIENELGVIRTEYDKLLAAPTPDTARLEATSQSIELKERSYSTLLDQYERVRLNDALLANTISVVEAAVLPEAPAKPRADLNLVLGFLVGLFGGIGLALLLENLDATLYTIRQIETVTKLPTVGKIPILREPLQLLDAFAGNGYQPQLEAFRRLRVNLLSANAKRASQVMLVTSAGPGEGKSTVVANLAIALAKSGRRVVVVDCDLYQPTLHKVFNLSNEYGLTSILMKQLEVSAAIQKSNRPNVYLITCGPPLPSLHSMPAAAHIMPRTLLAHLEQGAELLGSAEVICFIEQLKQEFDIVLLDTPALAAVIDAAVLAPLADRVLWVIARTHAQRDALRTAQEQLALVNVEDIGVVINYVEQPKAYTKYVKFNGRK